MATTAQTPTNPPRYRVGDVVVYAGSHWRLYGGYRVTAVEPFRGTYLYSLHSDVWNYNLHSVRESSLRD